MGRKTTSSDFFLRRSILLELSHNSSLLYNRGTKSVKVNRLHYYGFYLENMDKEEDAKNGNNQEKTTESGD